MSNDPSPYYGNSEREAYFTPGPLPLPGGDEQRNTVLERVRLPAIFLIVAALLNFLGALFMLIPIFQVALMSDADFQKQAEMGMQITEKMLGQKAPPGSQPSKLSTLLQYLAIEGAALVCTLLPLIGGIRMLALKNYGLCIAGALAAAVPCLSLSGCCGLGEAAGIWSLVVLMNDEVRRLFR